MLDDYTGGSQNLVFGSFFVGIVSGLGAFLRWTILPLDFCFESDILAICECGRGNSFAIQQTNVCVNPHESGVLRFCARPRTIDKNSCFPMASGRTHILDICWSSRPLALREHE